MIYTKTANKITGHALVRPRCSQTRMVSPGPHLLAATACLQRCRTVVRCSLLPGETARTHLIDGHVIQPRWGQLVGVIDRVRLSLGYAQCHARLRCLGVSHVARLTWPRGSPRLRQIVGVSTVPPCLVMSRLQIRLQAGRWSGRQVIAGLSTSAEGQRLQRIGRTAKDPLKLRRAIVVLMSAQGQSAPDIAHLLKIFN